MKSMQPKENNLLIEAGLTAGLLAISAFMLKAEFFWQYQILLLVGAAAGAAFAWYNRRWGFEQIKYLADAAILACVGWIIFRVFKSTFLYKEVIAILAQGLIVFEIIFVFNFLAPGKLGFIRILSLLVFLTSPVFPAQYNIPLAVIYLLIWIFVLRFQLPGYSHQPPLAGSAQRYYSLATSFVCFIIALVLAWSIASNIYLGRIKKGMLLLDEDLQNSGEGGKDTNQADKFYSLQENLQKKVTDMALKLDSYEKRRQMIYLFSELVKDTLKTIEMEKAEIGLVDILKRSGAGLEGVEETLSLTRSYCNMKTALQVQKNKENITDDLKKHPMSMVDKIKVTSLANKIQRTNSQAQLEQYSEAVQNVVDQAKLSKFSQRELNTMNRELVNQKTYELYRQKMQNLERQAAQLDKNAAAKAQEIIEDIQHAQGLDDLKQAVEKIRQLKNDPAVAENKAVAEVVKDLAAAARAKLDLYFQEMAEQVREDAAGKQGLGEKFENFEKRMDGITRARAYADFVTELNGLIQQNSDDNLGLSDGLGKMMNLKIAAFLELQLDKIESLLKKELPSRIVKEMMQSVTMMTEKDNLRDLERQLEELQDRVRELEKKEMVHQETATELFQALFELKELLAAKLKAATEIKKEQILNEGALKDADYIDQLQRAIDKSFLSGRQKEALKALADELLRAQSLMQLEEIKEVVENEIAALGAKGQNLSEEERKNLAAAATSTLKDLAQKIDNLEDVSTEMIQQLQDQLKNMQQAKDAQELAAAARELENTVKANIQDQQEQAKMLEEIKKLEEALKSLLEKKALSAKELSEINEINARLEQAAQIKKEFIMSTALREIMAKIEELGKQDPQKAQALKEKLEEMRKSDDPEEIEKITEELKEILIQADEAQSDAAQADAKQKNLQMQDQELVSEALEQKMEEEERKQMQEEMGDLQWEIRVLAPSVVVATGLTMPLKVIAINKNGLVKELNNYVEWFSSDPRVALVDELNFIHALSVGQSRIRAAYKGTVSIDQEINVVDDISLQTVKLVKQELEK